MNKYRSKRVKWDGMTFDSKRELKRWHELCILQKAGQIFDLKRQVKMPLRGAHYIADFTYTDMYTGREVIEDAKGYETPEFKLKRAILAAQGVEVVTV